MSAESDPAVCTGPGVCPQGHCPRTKGQPGHRLKPSPHHKENKTIVMPSGSIPVHMLLLVLGTSPVSGQWTCPESLRVLVLIRSQFPGSETPSSVWDPWFSVGPLVQCGTPGSVWDPWFSVGPLVQCGTPSSVWDPWSLVLWDPWFSVGPLVQCAGPLVSGTVGPLVQCGTPSSVGDPWSLVLRASTACCRRPVVALSFMKLWTGRNKWATRPLQPVLSIQGDHQPRFPATP
ncbi:uncharacterized protein LOC116969805 [Amblyraja radiata]|uniref:uncharacterized protein LOC116969805 n=1 Tax=Amblyraja radiata TaxID=386614 RepID=UPI001403B99D|nr:uncharacterized protein LOC116969805 [Amblyraja radiata]